MNGLQALERPVEVPEASRPALDIGSRNVRGGLVLLSIGFLAGLGMSLYAFQPVVRPGEALDQYDDLPRRLIRLGHIAAIMLPLINIVLGGWIDRLRLSARAKEWASWMLLLGAVFVPFALFVEAGSPLARNLFFSATPVIVFCAGIFIVSFGAARTRFHS